MSGRLISGVIPFILTLGLALASRPALAEDWTASWNKGFRLTSEDGKFDFKLGGRIQLDFTVADADAAVEDLVGAIENGSEARRARLFFSGTIYGNVEFKAQYDFAGGDAELKDLYIGFKNTPIGTIRIGHQYEPFSLEQLTSSKYITFLERGLPDIFSPARNVGIRVHNHVGERLSWAAGAFLEADGFGTSRGDGKLNLTGRVTGLPVWRDDGRRLLHLGVSLSTKDLGDELLRFRQRPEAHLAPRFVDTGRFAASGVDLIALEAAVGSGAFHAQAEYTLAEVDAPGLGDPGFDGWYVQAGYFLTGEHRPYDTKLGTFKRLSPKANAWSNGGRGAFEIALRFSALDLDDEMIAGGEMEDVTVAVNWYLNPTTRMMLNFVDSDLDGVGSANFALLRVQVDF